MDEPHKGTIHLSTFEEERRRLKLENHYLRWILDTLHKNITIRDAEPHLESQLPEVLMNDQTLVALTTNVWKVTHKFYDLEMELDYTYRRISQLFTMIVGGKGSEVTPSAKKNKITATGRKPRSSRDQTTEQSEQSLKLEKVLELIASAWRDMKEKERKVKYLEEEKRELQKELRSKELIIMKLKDNRDRNVLTQDQLIDIETRREVAEENLRLQREVNARIVKAAERTEKALVEKMKEYTMLEKDKKDLETKNEKLKQMNRKTLKEKQTLEELKATLEYEVSRLRCDMYSLKQKSENLEIFYIQQIEDGSSTIQNQALIIHQLNEEKIRLMTRLSTISSDRLTHENVNIADLSDSDRPTKLSEVYSELYDNEWTDAFEELTSIGQLTEKRAIEFLLQILLNAFEKCRQMTWDRYEAMKSVVITLDVINGNSFSSPNKRLKILNVPNHPESKSNHPPKVPDPVNQPSSSPSLEQESRDQATIQLSLSLEEEKEIKKAWKKMSKAIKSRALEQLCSVLITGLEINEKDRPSLSKYLIRCVEICWNMGVQEKPLQLEIESEKKDGRESIFDAETFRAYTKIGKNVDYIVWPALFLHEGGPMLSKGIAQGC